jgi:hypothetical protein
MMTMTTMTPRVQIDRMSSGTTKKDREVQDLIQMTNRASKDPKEATAPATEITETTMRIVAVTSTTTTTKAPPDPLLTATT